MVTIKFISLNLWHGGDLMPAILDFLKSEKPDVLAVQEAYNGQDPALEDKFRSVEAINNELDLPHHAFEPMFMDNSINPKQEQGLAVFSKFPIANSSATFFNEPYCEISPHDPSGFGTIPRIMQHAVIKVPAGELSVLNVHGVWDLDGDNDSPKRRNMVDIILNAAKGKANVIVAGDTNAKPTNPAMRSIEEHLKLAGAVPASTFNMRRKDNPGYATAAVDLLYVSPSIEVLSLQYPDVDVSDHLPLVATLEVGNA